MCCGLLLCVICCGVLYCAVDRCVVVQHEQGARYQFSMEAPAVVVTSVGEDNTMVRVRMGQEEAAVQVYKVGSWQGQPTLTWLEGTK